jgi:ATP phosphoribosyltransferase
VVGEVLGTESILISNPNSEHEDILNMLKKRIEGFMVAKKYVMISYNIHNDLLKDALEITPGKKSPNITNLSDSDYKAVTCLVYKKDMNKKMDELHDIGATDILTFALSNTRM